MKHSSFAYGFVIPLAFVLSACSGGAGSNSDKKQTNESGSSTQGKSDAGAPSGGDNGQNEGADEGGVLDGDGDGDGNGEGMSSCLSACEADHCGAVPDGCGGFLTCSECPEGQVCGVTEANRCGEIPSDCVPLTAQAACTGKCGAVSDGCSSVIACDNSNGGVVCAADEVCGGFAGTLKPNTCVKKPSCTPRTCESQGVECGLVGDGCGEVLDCSALLGGCENGQICGTGANSGSCVDAPRCIPISAQAACQGKCGIQGDGCGGTINCEADPATACPTGETCGGGGVPGQCGKAGPVCTPKSSQEVCAGKCGFQPDGCGGGYTCSAENGGVTCNAGAGESCGGGGTANTCGKPACTPKTQSEACPSVGGFESCGLVPDGCGSLINCGGCSQDQTCGLNTPNLCAQTPVCQPTPVATACAGKCGTVPNGCGGSYSCTGQNGGVGCTGSEFCGAISPNQCGTPVSTCTPKTCAQLGHSCGLASDGCGKVINCWPGCSPTNTSCTGSCSDTAALCISNATTGVQSCVTGPGGCSGALCNAVPTCQGTAVTRLTGTVRTPGRLQNGSYINQIAVPNAVVYIPANPDVALPSIFQGVQAGNAASCGRCEDDKLVADGETILASAVTNFKGEFTLEGRIPVGKAFELVVKVGKWRRVVEVPAGVAQSCVTKALALEYTRLPRNKNDGRTGTHLPKVAISTGEVDEMECVFRNIGIDESEFTVPSGTGRVHMYRANGARMLSRTCQGTYRTTDNNGTCSGKYNCGRLDPLCLASGSQCSVFNGNKASCTGQSGCTWTAATVSCAANNNAGCENRYSGCSWSSSEGSVPDSNLYSSQTTLNGYDMVVWDCEGQEEQHDLHDSKIVNYVNAGGRMFASHYSYTWIERNGSLDQSADWETSGSSSSGTGYISLPSGTTKRSRANPVKSLVFRDWLDWQGALTGTTANVLNNPATPQFSITDPRDRAGANVGPSTDEWVYRNSSGAKVQQLSFNTPYGAADNQICGRVAYSGFHVAATSNGGDDAYFPGVCSNGELSTQEKVLVFMLFDLAACVSKGDPPKPPSCTPKTAQNVCPAVNDACGFLSDGCGGVIDCAGCAAGFYCDGSTCRPQECTPSTCASLGFNCGKHDDGCGGIARNSQGVEGCGDCTQGQACGLGGPGLCGTSSCVPIAKAQACPANSCGLVSDGCGGTYDCGSCADGKVCGGGGANLCGNGSCAPIPTSTACAGLDCGLVSDGCGGTLDCGQCTLPDSCGGGGVANVCGQPRCDALTKEQACAGLECGWISDGCGGAIKCGDCPNGGVCGGAGPNLCGASCTPTSCELQNANCGAISDQCGGVLQCGKCPTGQTCGAGGPNKCGSGPSCVPVDCATQGAECGLVGDGCGGIVDCGKCTTAGETCGGAGLANQCGTGTGGCTELTCASQNVECGAASNGCGGLLDCGGCQPGFQCKAGDCVEVLVVQ